MKWSLIHKKANPALEKHGYRDHRVREFLRQEGLLRCAYCAVHENAVGGVQAFHIDHYKPKKKFPALTNSLSNLFYVCPICNRFKSDDWPANPRPTFSNSSYPNPSKVDYSKLFDVSSSDYVVSGLFVASKYIVEKLYLNRPQLILERRYYYLNQKFEYLSSNYLPIINGLSSIGNKEAIECIVKLAEISGKLNELHSALKTIPLYEVADVTKRKKK